MTRRRRSSPGYLPPIVRLTRPPESVTDGRRLVVVPGWRLVARRVFAEAPLPTYTVDLSIAVTSPVDVLVSVPEYTVSLALVYHWGRYTRERAAVVHPVLIVPAERHAPAKGHYSILHPRVIFGGMYDG